jgi:hypothetical protein
MGRVDYAADTLTSECNNALAGALQHNSTLIHAPRNRLSKTRLITRQRRTQRY